MITTDGWKLTGADKSLSTIITQARGLLECCSSFAKKIHDWRWWVFFCCSTDVSNANRNRNLIQRPCHESDSVVDCRLTDPIEPTALTDEFVERMKLWTQAHCKYNHVQKLCRCRIGIESHCSCTEVDEALLKNASGRKRKALRLETREWNKVCDQIWTEAHHFICSTSPSPLHREIEVKLFVSLLYASLQVAVSLESVRWHIFLCNYC